MEYQAILDEALSRTPQSMTEIITGLLRKLILEGVIKSNEKLSTEDIAKKLNVSRSPVREAFRKLESEGLVKVLPQKGVIVASISIKEIQEIIEIRVCLERLSLELAFKNIKPEDDENLKSILQKHNTEKDAIKVYELGMDFHECLYGISKNSELIKIVSQIRGKFGRYLRLHRLLVLDKEYNQKHHGEILNAILQRNEEEAMNLLEKHIRQVGDEIISFLLESDEKRKEPLIE